MPLVSQMLKDKSITWVDRGIDAAWEEKKIISRALGGFNPLRSAIYYPRISSFADWLERPKASARHFGDIDKLVYRVLFSVHDYLHCWSYQAIQSLCPTLGLGRARISEENCEDFVFCHLLTEACATVGLDYWYLSTIKLNEVVNLGTRISQLSISYHEDYESECRRFWPTLKVQQPGFLSQIVRFYCQGEFFGVDHEVLKYSPLLSSWLTHELTYGNLQRIYSRQWISSFCQNKIPLYEGKDLAANVRWSKPWQVKLAKDIGLLLWQKVNQDVPHYFKPLPVPRWKSRKTVVPNFRFTNLNRLAKSDLRSALYLETEEVNRRMYLEQLVSRYRLAQMPYEQVRLITLALKEKDIALMHYLLRSDPPLRVGRDEPAELFMLG